MVRSPDETEADLEKTDELPALDVASYEEQFSSYSRQTGLSAPVVADTTGDDGGPHPLPVLTPAETLRDIEAWIGAQEARAQAHERVVEELREARRSAQTRADNLALELDAAQKALRTALGRANDGERAALASDAESRAAESRSADLSTKLEEARQELATAAGRIAATNDELAHMRESLAAKAREHDDMRQRQAKLVLELEERSQRITQVDSDVARLRAQLVEASCELTQRAERIAAMQAASETQQAMTTKITRERDALAVRLTSFAEKLQSNEWKRKVWETTWRELDAELAGARALHSRIEAERAQLAATVGKLTAALSERDAVIGQLTADREAQALTLEEVTAMRARERRTHTTSAEQLRLRSETLGAQVQALEEQQRLSAKSLAGLEAELSESHAARTALEENLRAVQATDSVHAARVAELEGLATNMGRAVEAQSEAVQRANDLMAARERELAEERARIGAMEAELQSARREIARQAAATESTEGALNVHMAQLVAAQERVVNLEWESTQQTERLASLQAELAHARAVSAQGEASRAAVENELARERAELQREIERGSALDGAQRNLALELERTRGALDERELQLRRLERYATNSAQVLNRIRIGIAREENNPRAEPLKFPRLAATLVPLDDGDTPALTLGRYTTIGRAPESDLRLRHSSVSRRHAVLTIGSNGAFIEDLHSANGVIVNRQRIRHAQLADGDVIELGTKSFRFTAPTTPEPDVGFGAAGSGERVQ